MASYYSVQSLLLAITLLYLQLLITSPTVRAASSFVEITDDGDVEFVETIGERIIRAALPEYPDYWTDSDLAEGRTPAPRVRKCGVSYVGQDASLVPQRHGRRKRAANDNATNEEEGERIVGGVEAQPHEFPWQVSIRFMMSHVCGGSLVANRFVITAAHCFTKFKPIDPMAWKVLLGKHLSAFGERGELIADVADIVIYENYGKHPTSKHDGDIALIELVQPVPFTNHISPICIPGRAARLFSGTECWVVGWGETYKSSGITTVLRKALVPIIDTKMCRSFSRKLNQSVTDNMLCAGYAEGGVDACQGDSGGPLMCEVNGRWVLSGVVSWGIGCAEANSPGIYANTKKYIPWLMTHMKDKLRQLGWVPAPGQSG